MFDQLKEFLRLSSEGRSSDEVLAGREGLAHHLSSLEARLIVLEDKVGVMRPLPTASESGGAIQPFGLAQPAADGTTAAPVSPTAATP
jgi:hypothetical protein